MSDADVLGVAVMQGNAFVNNRTSIGPDVDLECRILELDAFVGQLLCSLFGNL